MCVSDKRLSVLYIPIDISCGCCAALTYIKHSTFSPRPRTSIEKRLLISDPKETLSPKAFRKLTHPGNYWRLLESVDHSENSQWHDELRIRLTHGMLSMGSLNVTMATNHVWGREIYFFKVDSGR